jgi:hypothetical protein
MPRRWMLVTSSEREIVLWHRRRAERIQKAIKRRRKR